MTSIRTIWLTLNTVRFLQIQQVVARIFRSGRRMWRAVNRTRAPEPKSWEAAAYRGVYEGLSQLEVFTPGLSAWVTACERAKNVAANNFTFLNDTRSFGNKIDWNDASASQLWRFNLHYFACTGDLLLWSVSNAMDEAYSAFRSLVVSWIEHNNRVAGDGWHPYTISIRLPQWLSAVAWFAPKLNQDTVFRDELLTSIYGQGKILRSELELDLRGNHLLANLRALIWLGVSFRGAESQEWLSHSMSVLETELEEQIPSDGGHFERCPGYHLVVLKDLLEIGLLLRYNRSGSPDWLESAIRRMLSFLVWITAPDGTVPLLKDTSFEMGVSPRDLVAAAALYLDDPSFKRHSELGLYSFLLFGESGLERFASWAPKPLPDSGPVSIALRDSGFYVMRDDSAGDYLIVDAGKPGPDYLPGHAHADMLSFELTVDGQRLVVDSGVYEYSEGDWRDYFRSTRAHNTIEVAGENQSEVWSSFRVARRANPGVVVWDVNDGYTLIRGSHDGYKRLPSSAMHERCIVWKPGKCWIILDVVRGLSSCVVRNYLHFHPKLEPIRSDSQTWSIRGSRVPLWVVTFGSREEMIVAGQTKPVSQGWYSELFGEISSNSVLAMTSTGELPIFSGYLITRERPEKAKLVTVLEGVELVLQWADVTHALRLAHGSKPSFS